MLPPEVPQISLRPGKHKVESGRLFIFLGMILDLEGDEQLY
jgi:hypothetical protein